MVPEDLSVPIGGIVAAVSIACIVGGARALDGRLRVAWIAGLLAWLAITGAIAERGVLGATTGPPVLPILVATAATAAIAIVRSRVGDRLAVLPLASLIALHAFRLPLEIAMHAGAGRGVPIELTWSGYNLDVVTGVTSIPIAILVALRRCPPWLIRAWCLVGFVCLFVILALAVATLPRVAAFGSDPAHLNTWVAAFPFAWVPVALVPVAFAGQVLVLRSMRSRPASS